MTVLMHGVALVFLLIATLQDLKKREVLDWLNYGLFSYAVLYRLGASVVSNDYNILFDGFLGFLFALSVSALFFYTGQWGGGDAKLLMALGTLLGWSYYLLAFTVSIFVMGTLFGLLFTFYLAIKNKKKFAYEFLNLHKKYKTMGYYLVILAVLAVALSINSDVQFLYLIFALILIMFYYLFLYTKAIENSCMLKYYNPKKLTEGDWIAEEVKYRGKVIAGPHDLGAEKDQISKILSLYQKGVIKKVLVKEGIPFVPGFLLGYFVTLYVFAAYLL